MKNTLADVKVEIGIKYSHVLDLSIEAEEGKHAAWDWDEESRCYVPVYTSGWF